MEGNNNTKILIVDDHPILRRGLSFLIDQENNFSVCAEADDAQKAMKAIKALTPDMIIVDISLPGLDGIELIKKIKHNYGNIPILVLSMHDEAVFAERALRAGARGYLMKQEAVDNIIIAMKHILAGEIFVSKKTANLMLEKFVERDTRKNSSPIEILSDREFTVFQLIGQGFVTRQIASELNLSVKTVESYRSHIKEKLKINNGNKLLKYAVQWVQMYKPDEQNSPI